MFGKNRPRAARALLASASLVFAWSCGGSGPGEPDAGSVVPDGCGLQQSQPLDGVWTLRFGGQLRTIRVHVPASYAPGTPAALVLDFHGLSSNAAQQELLTGMVAKADAAGFVAMHPEGLNNSWNAGACCGTSARNEVDDVGFVRALLDEAASRLCIDPKRVFATGMSNGGFLSHRLACEAADRIAAVAPVAGVMGLTECRPARPVSVMHFHGTLDTLVPYGGSALLEFPPVEQTLADWATRDGCTGAAVQTFSRGDSTCMTWDRCSEGVEVTLCTIEGGGHTWPGGKPVPTLGMTTTDLTATDAMWEFFQRHPMP